MIGLSAGVDSHATNTTTRGPVWDLRRRSRDRSCRRRWAVPQIRSADLRSANRAMSWARGRRSSCGRRQRCDRPTRQQAVRPRCGRGPCAATWCRAASNRRSCSGRLHGVRYPGSLRPVRTGTPSRRPDLLKHGPFCQIKPSSLSSISDSTSRPSPRADFKFNLRRPHR